ncbi:ABC transporter permease subunit [Roseomonas fluvialis]|uniref:ABC transporter permease n=1 Tax=Roseomonas fluvialis TaxID=1750527 RepID=A0ABM7YAY7_9PROT|nr:ABC transporter permease subunit [Roseomonas fluvialis]BDG75190.1 ABC transporter permease [Roseomonas fluvialis]
MKAASTGPVLAAPYFLWLMAAFAAPLGAVALLSVQESSELFAPLSLNPSAIQYLDLATDPFSRRTILRTLALGACVTLASAILGYPIALWLTRLPPGWRPLGFACVLVPLLTNVVVRSLGIILLLAPGGLVSNALALLGLPRVNLLFGWFAVGLALTQVFLPYMVLALYDVLEAQEKRLAEAAAGLGAGPVVTFFRVTLPLSLQGLRAGVVIVFLLSSTAYVSATLVGGRQVMVSGMVVLKEGLEILNYPAASALAMVMLAASVLVTFLIGRAIGFATPWIAARPPRRLPSMPRVLVALLETIGPAVSRILLAIALLLLLFPLVLVAVSSFNNSPQATVAQWLGFTWRWYAAVLDNDRYLADAWVSLKLGLAATVVSLAIALPAALALVRGTFPGREALSAFFMLPLALPGIAIGLGMLRLLQWFTALPAFLGILAVHVVLVAPFMLAMLRASVAALDRGLEEAASGLGAPPWRVFLRIVLPQLAPGIAVACLIGFLISFGEVTVTAFLTTARLQTLPVRLYAEASFSLENTINAISTAFILLTVALLLLMHRLVPLDRVWRR